MQIKNYWNLLIGKSDAERPAKLSFSNIKAVAQSFFRKTLKSIDGIELEQHIYEQIIWRRFEVQRNSPMCWYKGQCKVCGCDILGKTMENRACSIVEHLDLLAKRSPCYPEMMKEKEWKEYKLNNKIKFFD